MKKIVLLFIMTLLIFVQGTAEAESLYYNDAYHAYDAGVINLKINGKVMTGMEMNPVIIDDSTMVPVRDIFETIGAKVLWHDDTCQVEITDKETTIMLKIGDRNTYINGNIVPIDDDMPLPMLIGSTPAVLKTMVPVRFVAEKLGYDVSWYDATRTVSITDGSNKTQTNPSNIPDGYGNFSGVQVKTDDEYDYICINTRYGISPSITRYSSPERVVLDFEGAKFTGYGTVPVYGNSVTQVRYANFDGNARLVLDVAAPTQVVLLSNASGIMIRAKKSENTQIVYDAFAKRIYFDKNYEGKGTEVKNGYQVSFKDLKMKTQTIQIRDGKIYDIVIKETSSGCTVTVDGRNDFTYNAKTGIAAGGSAKTTDKDKDTQKPDTSKVNGSKTVVIDPGHGGHDSGAVGYNSSGKAEAYESHVNLSIGKLVRDKLTAAGVNVIMTRDTDEFITLAGRSEIANTSNCSVFVSIHCNSIDNSSVAGTQVYYHPDSEKGTILANNIYDSMVSVTGLRPMKTQNGSHLYVIRTTSVPAALVETAFISNVSDRSFLMSSEGQSLIAKAIAEGIIKTLNEI